MKARIRFALRLTTSLALIGALGYQIGSVQVFTQIESARWPVLVLVVLILASHVLFITPRWASILSTLGYKIHWISLLPAVFLGFLCNQVLPTGVGGDVLRAWRARGFGVPLNIGIYSVLLDRSAGMVTVLLGTIIIVPFTAPLAAHGRILWIAAVLLIGGLVGTICLWLLSVMPPSRFPFLLAMQKAIGEFNTSLHLLVRHPYALLRVIALSVIGQLIAAAAVGLLARELQIQISPVDIMVVTFGAMLAATIPISIAGWGVREGALVFLFGLYGVPAQTAFAVSILFGTCLIAASAPGALVLLAGIEKPAADFQDRYVNPERSAAVRPDGTPLHPPGPNR
jgi:uncharacterized membrane protein YbhN (UPF0104 family)